MATDSQSLSDELYQVERKLAPLQRSLRALDPVEARLNRTLEVTRATLQMLQLRVQNAEARIAETVAHRAELEGKVRGLTEHRDALRAHLSRS